MAVSAVVGGDGVAGSGPSIRPVTISLTIGAVLAPYSYRYIGGTVPYSGRELFDVCSSRRDSTILS